MPDGVGMDAPRFRLKLTRLDFISPVDSPAQETAKVLLIKRKGEVEGRANVVKVSEELGLVFCWAFTSKTAGADYYDLHNDKIDEDFVAAAASFMERGGVTDEMHDGSPDGRVVFAMPMTPDIAKAFGVQTDTVGLMVALKPSPEVLAKFKSGEYTGVSIQGVGERVEMRKGITIPLEFDASGVRATLDELLVKAQAIEASLSKSTRRAPIADGLLKMTIEDATAEIETLKAKLADAERLLALNPEERAAEIEKSDPVAFRGEASGITVRKSEATSFSLALAKAHEAQAVALAKQKADLAKQAEEIEKADVRKCAAETLGALTGDDELHDLIVRSVKKSGAPVEKIGEALEAMKGWNALAAKAGVAKGENPGSDPQPVSADEALAALTKGLETFAKSKNITKVWTEGLAAFTKTEEGAALKRAYDESRNA